MRQNPLTVITPIAPGQAEALKSVLDEIGNDVNHNQYIRFSEIRTTHFARWVIFDNDTRLLFTSNFDGVWQDYIDLLIAQGKKGVEAIWSKCVGYPTTSDEAAFRTQFRKYIGEHTIPTTTFYQGYAGHTVQEVHGYIKLRQELETVLSRDEFEPLFAAMTVLPPQPDRWTPIINQVLKVLGIPIQFVLGIFLNLVQGAVLNTESAAPTTRPSAPVNDVPEKTEWVNTVQNEMTVISDIDPAKLAKLKRVLGLLNLAARYVITDGTLSGITTIHFARWVIFDNDTRLLFESNYDGNWEQYIGDFVDRGSGGMDAIWGNCKGYPARGAKDLQAFKQVILDHQVRAKVWYSAYRYDSVKNIINDIAIANRLGKFVNNKTTADLLSRL